MSKTNQAIFEKAIAALAPTMRTAILNASVKLSGSTAKDTAFTGSGVIAYSSGGEVTIVSAKHNLYIFAEESDPPEWDDTLATNFQKSVSIKYDGPMKFNMDPARTAAITTVDPVTPDPQHPWEYDVMILTSDDADLVAFASSNCVYDLNYNQADLNYLLNENEYLKREGQTFIHTGYGSNRETAENAAKTMMPPASVAGNNAAGALQFRTSQPLASRTATVFNRRSDDTNIYDQAIDAIQITADPTSSTAPGDSGGPLFVVTRLNSQPRFFLIGVAYGADLGTAATPFPPPNSPLRVNNIASSLAYCYRHGLLGY